MTPVRLDSAALGLASSTLPLSHCAPEWDFMMSLSDDKQADIIEAFNTTSRYLDHTTLKILLFYNKGNRLSLSNTSILVIFRYRPITLNKRFLGK